MPQSIGCGDLVGSCISVTEILIIKLGKAEAATPSQINESTMEIDNHADMTVLGPNCIPVHYFERYVDVSEWYRSDEMFECPTISGAIAYGRRISGQVYMLVYHQVIHRERLANHLMYPIQSRMSGLNINEHQMF